MWYTIGWLLWIAWFAVEEGIALATHGRGNTLSEHVWLWFGILQGKGQRRVTRATLTWPLRLRRLALLAFLAWLCLHFLTGGAW